MNKLIKVPFHLNASPAEYVWTIHFNNIIKYHGMKEFRHGVNYYFNRTTMWPPKGEVRRVFKNNIVYCNEVYNNDKRLIQFIKQTWGGVLNEKNKIQINDLDDA